MRTASSNSQGSSDAVPMGKSTDRFRDDRGGAHRTQNDTQSDLSSGQMSAL